MTDFSPLVDIAASVASAVVSVCVPLAVGYIIKRTGIAANASAREALDLALTNGLGKAIQIGKTAGDANLSNVHIKNTALQAVVDYVVTNAPGAIAHFGLSPADIAEKAGLKLSTLLHVTTTSPTDPTPAPAPDPVILAPGTITTTGTVTVPGTIAATPTLAIP